MALTSLQVRGVPRYVRLSEKLRQDITSGALKPGDQLPSFTQTRAEYGISQATWEKIHATLEFDGLIVREPGRGVFVASPHTRSIRRTRTNCIGLVGYGFHEAGSSTYWAAILAGIQSVAANNGQSVLLLSPDDRSGWEAADGIITYGWGPSEVQLRVNEAIPAVSLFSGADGVVSIHADEQKAMQVMTAHLMELGHRRIAYLHGGGLSENAPRLVGYLTALREAGIKPMKSWRRALIDNAGYGSEFIQTGKETMRGWMLRGWARTGCTALLVHNDEAAVGVMEAFREAGIRVPHDVSVAGFDGLEIGAYYAPRLTTMQMPLQEIGARATSALLEMIEHGEKVLSQKPSAVKSQVFDCVLQKRESCARPRKS